MAELRFGTGGYPITNTGSGVGAVQRLSELGLNHMELEFVQSVFLTPEKAEELDKAASEADVSLSVHGSYYVNMASDDPKKFHGGITRVAKAAEIGALAGAKSVTYHSGFFQKKSFADVKPRVIEGMQKLFEQLDEKGADIKIAPELTGKASQVGDLPELIEIVQALREQGHGDRARLCIDFAHKYARSGGQFNTYDEFMQMLEDIRNGLGDEYLEALHIHVSAITYTDAGEKHHLTFLQSLDEYKAEGIEVEGIEKAWNELPDNRLEENKFNWQELMKALKKSNVGGYVVCESPILELDALLMQKYYQSL